MSLCLLSSKSYHVISPQTPEMAKADKYFNTASGLGILHHILYFPTLSESLEFEPIFNKSNFNVF